MSSPPLENAKTPTPSPKAAYNMLEQQLEEAEGLTNELKRLLVRYENALEHEGIRHQVEILERWMESYRRGLSAAQKISESGTTLLIELREKLKLAAEELQRLEGEGGSPLTKEQINQTEEFLKASRRIDQVIPNVEHILCHQTGSETPAEAKRNKH